MDTVTVKTSELIGPALDWAVAKCEGFSYTDKGGINDFRHLRLYDRKDRPVSASVNWSQGGPIIDRECISLLYLYVTDDPFRWAATQKPTLKNVKPDAVYGPTLLIAAMRCYVASKLGDTVQIPKGLAP